MKRLMKRLASDPQIWLPAGVLAPAISLIPVAVYGKAWEPFALAVWYITGGLMVIWDIQALREDWPRFLLRCRWRIRLK